jgi:hypothetical protein
MIEAFSCGSSGSAREGSCWVEAPSSRGPVRQAHWEKRIDLQVDQVNKLLEKLEFRGKQQIRKHRRYKRTRTDRDLDRKQLTQTDGEGGTTNSIGSRVDGGGMKGRKGNGNRM